ncbi:MAG TPA: alpha/beta fold hydrolase [Casimicrobiaceae bacterium]|nr:alpha/beta fold hydrolase [Casimicrobiaceae bacterium]
MDNASASTLQRTNDDTVEPTIVIVPGLRDHVPEHWQTHLEKKLAKAACVPRMERNKLSCAAWVAELDRTLAAIGGPVVLVAHSAGVMITVHWAKEHRRPIKGALLAAPPDFESPLPEGYPTQQVLRDNGWLPTPRSPLPFPAIVAASTNDPLGRYERVAELSAAWGSRLVDVGAVGHLNPASGYGEWPRALEFVRALGGTGASAR